MSGNDATVVDVPMPPDHRIHRRYESGVEPHDLRRREDPQPLFTIELMETGDGLLMRIEVLGKGDPVPRRARAHGLQRNGLVARHTEHGPVLVFGLAWREPALDDDVYVDIRFVCSAERQLVGIVVHDLALIFEREARHVLEEVGRRGVSLTVGKVGTEQDPLNGEMSGQLFYALFHERRDPAVFDELFAGVRLVDAAVAEVLERRAVAFRAAFIATVWSNVARLPPCATHSPSR